MDPSDEALLAGYATGDPRTAAAFVRRFQGRVYGLALTIVRQPALAEEVAQETFTRVYRHAGNYDARKGRVSTWLLSIARNLAIDVTRMKRLDPVDPEVIAAELTIDSQAPGADEMALQPDERDQLRAAISELPDDQRRALVLAAYMGRTAREISDLDDVPLGTVKTRIRTAMLKLRDRARGAGVMDPRCEEMRELAAELALGIVEGEERGRALQHLADCPDCRAEGGGALRGGGRAAAAGAAPRGPGGLRVAGARPRCCPQPEPRSAGAASPGARAGRGGCSRRLRITLAIVSRRPATTPRITSQTLRAGERQGVRGLSLYGGGGSLVGHRLQLPRAPPTGCMITVDPGTPRGADRARAGHRRRQPGAAATGSTSIPPGSSGGWIPVDPTSVSVLRLLRRRGRPAPGRPLHQPRCGRADWRRSRSGMCGSHLGGRACGSHATD